MQLHLACLAILKSKHCSPSHGDLRLREVATSEKVPSEFVKQGDNRYSIIGKVLPGVLWLMSKSLR